MPFPLRIPRSAPAALYLINQTNSPRQLAGTMRVRPSTPPLFPAPVLLMLAGDAEPPVAPPPAAPSLKAGAIYIRNASWLKLPP